MRSHTIAVSGMFMSLWKPVVRHSMSSGNVLHSTSQLPHILLERKPCTVQAVLVAHIIHVVVVGHNMASEGSVGHCCVEKYHSIKQATPG